MQLWFYTKAGIDLRNPDNLRGSSFSSVVLKNDREVRVDEYVDETSINNFVTDYLPNPGKFLVLLESPYTRFVIIEKCINHKIKGIHLRRSRNGYGRISNSISFLFNE